MTETRPADPKAAGNDKKKAQEPVYTPEHPEFPKLLYNQKTREVKSAADKEAEDKLAKDGFGEEALPPVDPNALSDAEVKEFQGLLAKVSKYVASLPTTESSHSTKPGEKANDKPQPHHV